MAATGSKTRATLPTNATERAAAISTDPVFTDRYRLTHIRSVAGLKIYAASIDLDRMMPLFSHRRQLRRWAARMLLVWLFGLMAGVANACILSAPNETGPVVPGLADDGHGEAAHAKANCLDFCKKAASGAPALQSALDNIGFTTLPAPAASTPYLVTCPGPAAPLRGRVLPDRPDEPSIRIAFLRLAL
jgi:hypothetical protein